MQFAIGCWTDKARLYRGFAEGKRSMVELGCSTGIMAHAFSRIPGLDYVGLDTDSSVIEYAKKNFREKPHFEFICQDAQTFSKAGRHFELVLLAGVLHHTEDSVGIEMLRASKGLVASGGVFVCIDPLRPGRDSPWLVHAFMGTFEKGQFLRSDEEYRDLFSKAGLSVAESKKAVLGATPLSVPKVSEFAAYVLQ